VRLMHDPPHPGAVIREWWLAGRDVNEAARQIGMDPAELEKLLEGRCGISPAVALKLAAAGWSNAPYWMRIQAYCDLAQERLRQNHRAA